MSKIEINKNKHSIITNMVFGFCNIVDGMIKIISFGFLNSAFALDYARNMARKSANKNITYKSLKFFWREPDGCDAAITLHDKTFSEGLAMAKELGFKEKVWFNPSTWFNYVICE